MRKRVIYIDIIHIKRVLRQLQLTESQHLSPVDHGMHENILIQMEASDIIPVSYTHLDVYKRQCLRRPTLSVQPARA